MSELLEMTRDEWLLVLVATALSVGGLLLRSIGNLLGQIFLGEDPVVRRWRSRWMERREHKRAQRKARKELRREKKRLRRQRALAFGCRRMPGLPGGAGDLDARGLGRRRAGALACRSRDARGAARSAGGGRYRTVI